MPVFKTQQGDRLFYRLQGKGQGRPLILVHGWCSNLEHWSLLVKHFSRKHPILAIDRRGMGRSTGYDHGHSVEQHAQDTAELARALGLRGAIIIGHAGGGPVALQTARQYKQLVKAVVMVDSMLTPPVDMNDANDAGGAALAGMVTALESGGHRALRKIYRGFFTRHCDKALARQTVEDAARTPMPVVIDELRQLARGSAPIADEVKQPVLWLTVDAAPQDYIGEHLAKVQFGQLVGSGHFPQLEIPSQTNAMIDTFIKQLG